MKAIHPHHVGSITPCDVNIALLARELSNKRGLERLDDAEGCCQKIMGGGTYLGDLKDLKLKLCSESARRRMQHSPSALKFWIGIMTMAKISRKL